MIMYGTTGTGPVPMPVLVGPCCVGRQTPSVHHERGWYAKNQELFGRGSSRQGDGAVPAARLHGADDAGGCRGPGAEPVEHLWHLGRQARAVCSGTEALRTIACARTE